MKHKPIHLIFLAAALSSGLTYGQGALAPTAKKPRTLEDYKASTLKEIVKEDPKREGLLPFRVTVIFENSARPISKTSNEALHRWAQCCAGNPDHYTKSYLREMQFVEDGTAYWLPVQDSLVADFLKELKAGEVVDLFLIRLSAPETNGKKGSVLLVERFQGAGTNSDQVKASLDWITSNLPQYTGKDLKVEIPGPCQLSIADSSNSAGVSKAVVWIPLIDLDPSKVSVEPQHGSDTWGLWLHTTPGKNSIKFMLYQGGPAEGGETNKYSLTLPVKEKAESMAEAFRRAINLCAAKPVS
ncbi:MAG: hypothetical protein ND866_26535 [Pyrinomonadaceae bacterium]|nr:hypothetical protein [Pyrinomonadaceae bacterium]